MPPGKTVIMSLLATVLVLFSFVHLSGGLAVMSVDLGSQFMKVAIVKPGVPMEIALNKESRRKTPVAVSFRNGERLFGDNALGVAVSHPPMSYVYIHDLLAKKFDNPQIKQYRQRFPWYDLEEDKETGTALFKHPSGSKYSPEELLAMILNNSRIIAEDFAEHPMKDVVITVPVYFNQAERRAVLRAAELVGLNVLQLMNDNTAVALNFGLFQQKTFNESLEKHVMFYDMGASSTTTTIVGYSIVKSKERGITEKVPQLAVKGVGFARGLGGHAIDIKLRDHLAQIFKKNYKAKGDVTKSPRAMAKFYKEALRVKQVLSANTEHFAQIEGVFEDIDFRAKITRAELEEMCSDIFERVPDPVYKALKAAAMTMNDIESVILVGGGTRVPKVQEVLLKAVEKQDLAKNINADEAAAMGAVYQAANLGKGFKVKAFQIRDSNIFPIEVSFDRHSKADDGTESVKHVKRVLYHHGNVIPQKKVMTFNKHNEDFRIQVSYSGLENILTGKEIEIFGPVNLTTVNINGVAAALTKHNKGTPKGIKAYFRLDESGMFKLDKVESVFEKMPEDIESEEQSTFAKLGSKISSFFGGSEDKKDEKTEEPKDEEKTDKSADDKPETKKEEEKEKEENKPEAEDKEQPKGEKTKPEKEEEKKEKEEPKQEEKPQDKEKSKNDEKKEDMKDDKDAKKKTEDTKANKTEEASKKKEPVKPVLVRESLETTIQVLDFVDPSKDSLTASKTKLEQLQALDEAKKANERARNALESHIFTMRDHLYSEIGETLSTEQERETISQALSQASDWLDDEGWDAKADAYKEKLGALKKISQDLRTRLKEHELRPKAVAALLQSLNLSTTFFRQVQNMTERDEIYTARDLEDLDKTNNETKDWLTKTMKKQNETKPHENPVVMAKEIEAKQLKIDRELVYLLNKAKYFVPKPKVNETTVDGNKTTANDTKSSNKTTEKTNGFKAKKAFKKEKTDQQKPKPKTTESTSKEKKTQSKQKHEVPLTTPSQEDKTEKPKKDSENEKTPKAGDEL